MKPAEALAILRASANAEHDAPIWNDDGRTITQLAHEVGWRVAFVHVDLTERTTELRTVEAVEQEVF
jgi:hypothetical protein